VSRLEELREEMINIFGGIMGGIDYKKQVGGIVRGIEYIKHFRGMEGGIEQESWTKSERNRVIRLGKDGRNRIKRLQDWWEE